jgi:small subunit ribosomal protein S11
MPKQKKKISRTVSKGRIYIHASFNNTIITITDESGGALSWATSGSTGFKGSKKSTPFAAQSAMKKALDDAAPYNLESAQVFVSGVGNGRDASLRAITQSNLDILSIKDVTPIAHNGVRAKKPRRV